jgi:phosphopantothenoylcysteine decarboxylase/phosphopantothenate--cysteine ligase
MDSLEGKHIIIGVTGSIAAYKAAMLIRGLVKKGVEIKVVMTPLAKEFITPLTLATLSKHSILVDFFNPENGEWNSHVDLGLWADAYLIAPATANTIGKMASGIADNLLLTTYLSAKCPVFVAPAMDLDMFRHPATQQNLQILAQRGNAIIEPTSGELASGLEGKGRMEEPDEIVSFLENYFSASQRFCGKTILVNAGPTYEAIDPVRFIGNYSSGKMGYAIAEAFANQGASVILVSGPTHLQVKHKNITIQRVTSAEQMNNACVEAFAKCNGAVLSAAVADFTPESPKDSKIKRGKDDLIIALKPTADIAANLGTIKRLDQFLVGFALETNNEEQNALHKLHKKKLDFIVLNSLNDPGAGFNVDTNKVKILWQNGEVVDFQQKSKAMVAQDIVEQIYRIVQH